VHPVKVSWPGVIYAKFMRIARLLGYLKRGERWIFLDLLLDYAEAHLSLFRKR
jgi:hypothetical protein